MHVDHDVMALVATMSDAMMKQVDAPLVATSAVTGHATAVHHRSKALAMDLVVVSNPRPLPHDGMSTHS
jgi:hypothetical protein